MTLSASDAALHCPAGVVTRFAAAVPARPHRARLHSFAPPHRGLRLAAARQLHR